MIALQCSAITIQLPARGGYYDFGPQQDQLVRHEDACGDGEQTARTQFALDQEIRHVSASHPLNNNWLQTGFKLSAQGIGAE